MFCPPPHHTHTDDRKSLRVRTERAVTHVKFGEFLPEPSKVTASPYVDVGNEIVCPLGLPFEVLPSCMSCCHRYPLSLFLNS